VDLNLISDFHPSPSWLRIIFGLLVIWAGIFGGWTAFSRGYRKKLPEEEIEPPLSQTHSEDWESLCTRAGRVIEDIIAQLPPDVAAEAKTVPCLFEERAQNESSGYRTLGRYHNFTPGRKSNYKGPIFLYLKRIQEVSKETKEDFETVVKTTYLHELGHHFGWDEVDLVRHGLPSGRPPGG
jgi:predicted Zn-dependent protease with MMP-like domain